MVYVPTLKKMYKEQIVPALVKEFNYTSVIGSGHWRQEDSGDSD